MDSLNYYLILSQQLNQYCMLLSNVTYATLNVLPLTIAKNWSKYNYFSDGSNPMCLLNVVLRPWKVLVKIVTIKFHRNVNSSTANPVITVEY